MNRTNFSSFLFVLLVTVATTLAQQAPPARGPATAPGARGPATGPGARGPQVRPSPLDVVNATVDGSRVLIYHSRPFSKDPNSDQIRKIWGTLVPYGAVWRFGANEATHLVTPSPLTIGGATVPAGTYSLFMLPAETGPTKLIINKQFGNLGNEYDDKQDVARVDMTRTTLPEAVNQFTLAITPNPAGGGVLSVRWENTEFSVPIAVKK